MPHRLPSLLPYWVEDRKVIVFSKNLFFVGVGFCPIQTWSSYLIEW